MDTEGTRFWDVHATQEVEHAGWSMEALRGLVADPVVVQAAATVSADSWWLFLSEREEMAPADALSASAPSGHSGRPPRGEGGGASR